LDRNGFKRRVQSILADMRPYHKYSKVYDLLLKGERNYDADCDFIESDLTRFLRSDLKPLRILDIGCGTGEHAIMLSRRGYQVTGIDVSKEMIEQAVQKAKVARVRAEFFVQDMRRLKLNQVFDCALSIFGSFTRLMDEGDYKRFYEGLHHHLRSRGLFIFDFINTDGVIPNYRDWKFKKKGNLTVIRLDSSDFQRQENLLNERHECFIIKNGKIEDHFIEIHKLKTHRMREIKGILEAYGFNLVKTVSEVVGYSKPKESFAIRVVARKRD